MVRKSGSRLPDSPFILADSVLAEQIGEALTDELGASRRAAKTVMRWAGVSDRTARSWLHGRVSPSGRHLLALAAHSSPVMIIVLRLTGHPDLELGLETREIEARLQLALAHVQAINVSAFS